MHLLLTEIAEWINADLVGPTDAVVVHGVSTDTRKLRPGDVFVALKGPNFDGHHFVGEACRAGAKAIIVERRDESLANSIAQLVVRDTLFALGEIARLWRQHMSHVPIAVVVGSSGKTTVKEMASEIVKKSFPTLATEGNLNNLIGVPLTLFRLEDAHRAAVIELGMNAPGELRRLTEIVAPDCVALTNIRNAHVGMFPSPEGLYLAKCESLRYAPPHATLILNADDPASQRAFREWAQKRSVIRFGYAPEADVRATNVRPRVPFGYEFDLQFGSQKPVSTELYMFGQHNIVNALAAVAIASYFGVDLCTCAEALRGFRSAQNRSEVEEINGVFFVKDYYNASPAAVEAALLSLNDFSVPGRRFAVLADMLELGTWETQYHQEIGETAARRAGLTKLY
ncbi:MAG: UDP-N-acetylmuramoyl-tripeptide--D-alanyl-D-alanine ligase, partial [Candidatus Sumerlaeaceae bacterium]|nr:UDP-N-acetylmuramoyl-tripeptide--D-alanyl-D-alanine ligase [Candidatus Sumerlaeaceae bacterium]